MGDHRYPVGNHAVRNVVRQMAVILGVPKYFRKCSCNFRMSMQASRRGKMLCRWPTPYMLWDTKMHTEGVPNTSEVQCFHCKCFKQVGTAFTTLNVQLHLLFPIGSNQGLLRLSDARQLSCQTLAGHFLSPQQRSQSCNPLLRQ